MKYILDDYVNERNIDILCKLYGLLFPKNVKLHYEIKRMYFLDYINNAKFFGSGIRPKPDGKNDDEYTIYELKKTLYEAKNVNYWESYITFIGEVKIQKSIQEFENFEYFEELYSEIDEFKIKLFNAFLRHNVNWNYEKHLVFFIDKLNEREDFDNMILKSMKQCIISKNYFAIKIILNNVSFGEETNFIKYACGAWDLNILEFLKEEGFDIYVGNKNIVYCMKHFWRYNKDFLVRVLKPGTEISFLEALFNTDKIYDFKLLCTDILETILSAYKLNRKVIPKKYIYLQISNNRKFEFLRKVVDKY